MDTIEARTLVGVEKLNQAQRRFLHRLDRVYNSGRSDPEKKFIFECRSESAGASILVTNLVRPIGLRPIINKVEESNIKDIYAIFNGRKQAQLLRIVFCDPALPGDHDTDRRVTIPGWRKGPLSTVLKLTRGVGLPRGVTIAGMAEITHLLSGRSSDKNANGMIEAMAEYFAQFLHEFALETRKATAGCSISLPPAASGDTIRLSVSNFNDQIDLYKLNRMVLAWRLKYAQELGAYASNPYDINVDMASKGVTLELNKTRKKFKRRRRMVSRAKTPIEHKYLARYRGR